jgi:hypothetical protein
MEVGGHMQTQISYESKEPVAEQIFIPIVI